jgi:hypothetical protein
MDAEDVLRLIVDAHNAWMDAEMAKLKAIHAELQAQVLPRPPLVLPPRHGEGQRAMRRRDEPR